MNALAREMLLKFAAHPDGTTIPALFEGLAPVWAVDAAHRLANLGLVTRDNRGVYTLTDAAHQFQATGRLPGTFDTTHARKEREGNQAGGTALSRSTNGRRVLKSGRTE